jgi:SHS2 domain-containing protein
MSYRYLEDLAIADIAFEAQGESLAAVFLAAADATTNVMIEDLESIRPAVKRTINLESTDTDMLLFDLLQELIYYKDAEQLLLRVRSIDVKEEKGRFLLTAIAHGERLDPKRHDQRADVKAVTLHRFTLQRITNGWRALVILDV